MNLLAKLLGRKDFNQLLSENESLRAEVEGLKKELELTKLKKELAEEQAAESMKLNKLLLNPPKIQKPN